jgi:hypothetical protein
MTLGGIEVVWNFVVIFFLLIENRPKAQKEVEEDERFDRFAKR